MGDMGHKTYEMLEKVNDRDSFIAFLAQLRDDWEDSVAQERVQQSHPYGPAANGWENGNIGTFLDAAHAWAASSAAFTDQGETFDPLPPEPSWKTFATILMMGKTYE